ncbi:MAG TPA: plastocyanin/azurin family copper-binding protein [Gemmatimonadaceae bacterium]
MRFYGIALLAGATLLGACGGEKQSATDSAAANAANAPATNATPATTPASAPAATPAAGAPAGGAAVAPAPVTGTTHEVKMYGDAKGYRFEPATLTIKSGDGVKYVLVDGGPHNVNFLNVTDPAVKAQLDANMPGQKMGELNGPMLMQPNETYPVSFGKIPPGKYDYQCVPHSALGMKGSITVQ